MRTRGGEESKPSWLMVGATLAAEAEQRSRYSHEPGWLRVLDLAAVPGHQLAAQLYVSGDLHARYFPNLGQRCEEPGVINGRSGTFVLDLNLEDLHGALRWEFELDYFTNHPTAAQDLVQSFHRNLLSTISRTTRKVRRTAVQPTRRAIRIAA